MIKSAVLLALIIGSQAQACDLPIGKYKLFTESHWGVNLELKVENTFTVIWGAYNPGEPDSTQTRTYHGKWTCENDAYRFEYQLESVNAEYRKSEYYPYGVYKNQKAIIFQGEPERGKYLSGHSFWPVKEF